MAAFRFQLAPALERAYANETLARAVIVDARLAHDASLMLLAATETRAADARAAAALPEAGAAGCRAVAEAALVALLALYRARASEALRTEATLSRARTVYASVANERRALEQLRERRLEAFRQLRESAEAAEADEENALRANRRSDAPGGDDGSFATGRRES